MFDSHYHTCSMHARHSVTPAERALIGSCTCFPATSGELREITRERRLAICREFKNQGPQTLFPRHKDFLERNEGESEPWLSWYLITTASKNLVYLPRWIKFDNS